MSIYFNGIAPMGEVNVVNVPSVTIVLDITGDMPAQYRIGYEYNNGDRVWLDWTDYFEECVDVALPCGDGVYKILAQLRDANYFETDILETIVTVDAEQDMLSLTEINVGAFSFDHFGWIFEADVIAKKVDVQYLLDITFRYCNYKVANKSITVDTLYIDTLKNPVFSALESLMTNYASNGIACGTSGCELFETLVSIIDRMPQENMGDGYYYVFGSAYHAVDGYRLITTSDLQCYSEEWEGMPKQKAADNAKEDLILKVTRMLGLE